VDCTYVYFKSLNTFATHSIIGTYHPFPSFGPRTTSTFSFDPFQNIHRWLKTVGIEQPQKLSFYHHPHIHSTHLNILFFVLLLMLLLAYVYMLEEKTLFFHKCLILIEKLYPFHATTTTTIFSLFSARKFSSF